MAHENKIYLPGYFLVILCITLCCVHVFASEETSEDGRIRSVSGVIVVPKHVIYRVDPRFYSFGLGCNLHWNSDISNPVIANLVKELSPAFVRLGGTLCQAMTFRDKDVGIPVKNVTLTSRIWDNLNAFVRDPGLDLIFDANILIRTENDTWDPTDFTELLEYSSSKGYPLSFELGNEPNNYQGKFNRSVSPEQTAGGFQAMRHLLQQKRCYRDALVIGPDVGFGKVSSQAEKQYLKRFLDSISRTTDATSIHFYYHDPPTLEAQLVFLTDMRNLNLFGKVLKELRALVRNHRPRDLQAKWIGESGLFTAPCRLEGISDGFISGMVWLDRLGLGASLGIEVIVRNRLISLSHFGLFGHGGVLHVDYWSTVLFKRLVGTNVLKVHLEPSGNTTVPKTCRVYTHCTKTQGSKYGYQPGAVTVFAINFNLTVGVKLSFNSTGADLFLITPTRPGNVTSKNVALNGHELSLNKASDLPEMPPVRLEHPTYVLPPGSMAFFVVNVTNFDDCKKSHR